MLIREIFFIIANEKCCGNPKNRCAKSKQGQEGVKRERRKGRGGIGADIKKIPRILLKILMKNETGFKKESKGS